MPRVALSRIVLLRSRRLSILTTTFGEEGRQEENRGQDLDLTGMPPSFGFRLAFPTPNLFTPLLGPFPVDRHPFLIDPTIAASPSNAFGVPSLRDRLRRPSARRARGGAPRGFQGPLRSPPHLPHLTSFPAWNIFVTWNRSSQWNGMYSSMTSSWCGLMD
jgi:hypothetical protein